MRRHAFLFGVVVFLGLAGQWGLPDIFSRTMASDDSDSDPGPRVAREGSASTVEILSNAKRLGSGFIFENGTGQHKCVVTNAHVVADASLLAIVHPKTNTRSIIPVSKALIVDQQRDLAIFPVPPEFEKYPALRIAAKQPESGETVYALGAPQGLVDSISRGICSGIRADGLGRQVIQTDATINPGNSGGPLVNRKVGVVGIVTYMRRNATGLNFAIDVSELAALLEGRATSRPIRAGAELSRPPSSSTINNYRPSSRSQYVIGSMGTLFWNGGDLGPDFTTEKIHRTSSARNDEPTGGNTASAGKQVDNYQRQE